MGERRKQGERVEERVGEGRREGERTGGRRGGHQHLGMMMMESERSTIGDYLSLTSFLIFTEDVEAVVPDAWRDSFAADQVLEPSSPTRISARTDR